MNYFIHTFAGFFGGIIIMAVEILLLLSLVIPVTLFLQKFIDKLKLSERAKNIIGVVLLIVLLISGFFLLWLIDLHVDNGKIKELRITQKNNAPCLSVWLSAQRGGKVSTWYVKKLKIFDIETGKLLEDKILAVRDYFDDERIQKYEPSGWMFDPVAGTKAKTLRHRFSRDIPQREKPRLIVPSLVKELDKKAAENNRKVWVIHYSTYIGDFDTYLSYMDSTGRELNRVNLDQLFKAEDATALATFTRKDETLIYISRQRYTLTALRADPATGKILGNIEYFK